MNKALLFAKLDFLTIKPYLTARNLVLYAAVALFLTTMSGSPQACIGVGIMLATLMMSYPFAIGEKSNMDTFYTALAIERKTVVFGRYLFALGFNVCAIVLSGALSLVGLFIAAYMGLNFESSGNVLPIIILGALFLVVQMFQLPIYFKLGYARARFMSFIPIVGFVVIYFLLGRTGGFSLETMGFFSLFNAGSLAGLILVLVVVLVLISCRLSLSFYQKREF